MADKTFTIVKSVADIPEKTYSLVEFELPENVFDLTISYIYKQVKVYDEEKREYVTNIVDIALLAPDGGQIGASGCAYSSLYISPNYSSNGYSPYEFVAGKYAIVLGLYRKLEDFDITYTIEYNFKRTGWYAGDGHLHTVNSDGVYTLNKLVKKGYRKHLDWMIITDHNNSCKSLAMPTIKGLCIIPGMELTCYLGHMNLWGSKSPIYGAYMFNNNEDLLRLEEEAKSNGACLSLNHPHCKKCGWHLSLDDTPMDCVEVWNGPMRIDNMSSIRWWHEQLLQGKRLPAVGGSDYHRDYIVSSLLAEPTTFVYAKSNSQADILYGLTHGHSFLTKTPKSTKLYLTAGDKQVGDTVTLQEAANTCIEAIGMKKGHTLRVYNNDEIIYTYTAKRKGDHKMELKPTAAGFVRAEITFQKGFLSSALHKFIMRFMLPEDAKAAVPELMWAMTNAIYITE